MGGVWVGVAWVVRGHTAFSSCSTARTWRPEMRRAARHCSTPARLAASCVRTSSCSTAAQERAAAPPPPPARPPPPALPPRPARGAGAARPAWAEWTPRSRWYSCPAAGETPLTPARAGHDYTGWTAGQMHPLTFPVCTPPHGSTSYPLVGTAPHASQETQTHLPLPSGAWRPWLDTPLTTVSLLGLPWVCLLGVCRRARPCSCVGSRVLGFAGSCSLGAGKRSSPACGPQSGGGSQNPGWLLGPRYTATPEGGFRNGSPGTWDQFGDPTLSMLISLPSEGEGQRGAGPLLPMEVCVGGPQPFP